jgi:hypothetical protein
MAGLSLSQERALAAVAAAPGTPARELPGGINTVWALMRRGLVETDTEKGVWRVFLPAHEHSFKTTLHMDGCHYYSTSATCDCGVVYGHRGERHLKSDPYGAVWMEGVECERCDALRDGARPISETVIQRPRSYQPPLEAVA